jgi:hypothetical protein
MGINRNFLKWLWQTHAISRVTIALIKDHVGVSETTARRYLQQAEETGLIKLHDTKPVKSWTFEPIDVCAEEDDLGPEEEADLSSDYVSEEVERCKVREVRSQTRAAIGRVRELETLLEGLTGLEEYRLLAPKERRMEPLRPLSADEFVPLVMFSDVHCGEGVDPDSVNHLNQYNPDIATQRAANVTRNAQHMIDRARRAGSHTEQMCLWWGGDFMNGYIHDGYKISNVLTPAEEVLLAYDILHAQLEWFLDFGDYERIDVLCNSGNHARLTEKMVAQVAGKTSWEWALYHMLRKAFKDEPRVSFHIATGYMLYHDVFDTRLCLHHGEAIRGGGGVGGITAPVRRAIMKWNEQTPVSKQPFHILGHFYQVLTDMRSFFMNGSVVGYNAYAQKGAFPYEPPQQGLCYIVPGERVPVEFHRVHTT